MCRLGNKMGLLRNFPHATSVVFRLSVFTGFIGYGAILQLLLHLVERLLDTSDQAAQVSSSRLFHPIGKQNPPALKDGLILVLRV